MSKREKAFRCLQPVTVSQLSCFQLICGWQGKAELQNANFLHGAKLKNPFLFREKGSKIRQIK